MLGVQAVRAPTMRCPRLGLALARMVKMLMMAEITSGMLRHRQDNLLQSRVSNRVG